MLSLLKKEIRTRMRGKTIFIIENTYLILLVLVVSFILYLGPRDQGWEVGRTLFSSVNYIQILILVLVSSSIPASAITLEKEQKTYDILIATPLSAKEIILAKLIASLSYFLILSLIALPVISICFILGGVSVQEVLLVYLITIGSTLLAGLIGLYLSCISNRTLASVPISGIIVVSSLILTIVVSEFSPALGAVNPITSLGLLMGDWVVKFFSLELPFWIPYIVLTGLFSLLLLTRSIEMLKIEEKRNFIISQIILLLIYISVFILTLGSIELTGYKIEEIREGLSIYLYILLFLALTGIGMGSGLLWAGDKVLLRQGFLQSFLSLRGWFGGGVIPATKFSILIVIAGLVIFGLGIQGIPLIKDKSSIILLSFWIILSFITASGLLCRFLSINPLTRGRFLPRIIAGSIIIPLLILPLAVSAFVHKEEAIIKKTPIDLILFLSPIKSISATIDPKTLDSIPYCKDLLGGLPFAVVTSLFYTSIALLLGIANVVQERKIKDRLF